MFMKFYFVMFGRFLLTAFLGVTSLFLGVTSCFRRGVNEIWVLLGSYAS